MERNGDWIQTYTGNKFYPLDPRPEEIYIFDIAHALSMLCRYGGHCQEFYSVAEHSILVSENCSPENALWGLLHDASEAYLVDVPRPIKALLPGYKEIESQVTWTIAQKFGLSWPMPDEVKRIDDAMLVTEKDPLMLNSPEEWKLDQPPIAGVVFHYWFPLDAKEKFLARFYKLTKGKTGQGWGR